MYEFANFDYQTNVLELTRLQGSSESLVGVEFPTVIAPLGDVQIFKDRFGYDYATGNISKVYARINKPWSGVNSGYMRGGGPDLIGTNFQAIAPDGSENHYGINLWVDWNSVYSDVPYNAGQFVEITYGLSDSEDVSNYDVAFMKPVDAGNLRSVASLSLRNSQGEIASEGELCAYMWGFEDENENRYYGILTQDGINPIGGVLRKDSNDQLRVEVLASGILSLSSQFNIGPTQQSTAPNVPVLLSRRLNAIVPQVSEDWAYAEANLVLYHANGNEAHLGDNAPILATSEL